MSHHDETPSPKCQFCGGKGIAGEKVKNIKAAFGGSYRIPESHKACKKTVQKNALPLFAQ